MAVADLPELAQILRGRVDEAALALDRLDQDRGHLLGVHVMLEEILFKVGLSAIDPAPGVGLAPGAAVAIGVFGPEDARGVDRAQAPLVGHDLAGQGHGQKGPAVEPVLKGDDTAPPGMVAGDLDRVLHGLGSGVGKHGLFGSPAGDQPVQFFGQLDIGPVHHHVETGVKIFIRLGFDRLHHLPVAVPHVEDPDSPGEIDKFTPVHIRDQSPFGPGDEEGGYIAHPPGNMGLPAFGPKLGLTRHLHLSFALKARRPPRSDPKSWDRLGAWLRWTGLRISPPSFANPDGIPPPDGGFLDIRPSAFRRQGRSADAGDCESVAKDSHSGPGTDFATVSTWLTFASGTGRPRPARLERFSSGINSP